VSERIATKSMSSSTANSNANSNANSSNDSDPRGNKIVMAFFLNKIDRINDDHLQAWQQEQENTLSEWCD